MAISAEFAEERRRSHKLCGITLDKQMFQLSGGLRLIAQKIPSGLTTGSFPAECFLSLDKRTQIKKFDKNNQVKKSP